MASAENPTVQAHAAGSLRAAFTELARAFEAQRGVPVRPSFGASDLLKDRLAGGEASDLFASAFCPASSVRGGSATRALLAA